MIKSIRFFTAVALVATVSLAACGGDDNPVLPGLSVPNASPATNGAQLAGDMESDCDACDGDLGNAGIAAVKGGISSLDDDDAEALFYLIRDIQHLDKNDITTSDTFESRVNSLTEPTDLTFNRTMRINCNSTGESGEALGDASGGTITESLVFAGTFDDGGQTEDSDNLLTAAVSFSNCVLSGDILDQTTEGVTIGDPAAIRLNGGYVLTVNDPATPSPTTPASLEGRGVITLATDGDDDGVFGNEFWTDVVHLDFTASWDGSMNTYNGGICAGERVLFGMDDEDDSDDSCASDTDSMNDAFATSDDIDGFDLWD